ncbi:MAG: AtpZ/AtpI family protein [Firmicutes bacterium]|nr:AtpZ/AtpI family protein [Candidatus Fermentithermobacillaceae bacterium]
MTRSPGESDRKQPAEESMGKSFAVLGAGFSIVVSALGGMVLGSYLDRRGQSHLFAAIGFLLGLLAGLHRAYLLIRSIASKRRPP